MKILDEILDAMGLYDEEDMDEELEAARKNRKAKAEQPKKAERNSFAKPAQEEKPKSIKEIYEDDEDDEEDEENGSIFSFPFFGKKKSVVEETENLAPKKEASKAAFSSAAKPEAKEEAPKKSIFGRKTQEATDISASQAAEEKPQKTSFFDRFRSKENRGKDNSMPITVRNKEINVMVIEPASFDDCPKIADYLRNNQPVVINFENIDPAVAKRMADFISGSVYAINGTIKKVGRSILICAPRNVDVDAAAQYDTGDE